MAGTKERHSWNGSKNFPLNLSSCSLFSLHSSQLCTSYKPLGHFRHKGSMCVTRVGQTVPGEPILFPPDVWKWRQGPAGRLAPGGALSDQGWAVVTEGRTASAGGGGACLWSTGKSCSFSEHRGPMGSPGQCPTPGPQNNVVVKLSGFSYIPFAVN